MFVYEKKLEYPIRIKNSNPALAKFICSQYGGPDGELGASLRYLSQRYAMPYPELSAILTDIGTEELGHLEMVGTIVYQLTRCMTPEQIKDEIKGVAGLIDQVYNLFGFKYHVELSTRPDDSMGSDEDWELATDSLRAALDDLGLDYVVNEGDGAFYGPKIDFHLEDSIGRTWQCGTIQLDFQLPLRFDLHYTGADGEKHRPIMIHRVAFGSIERFIGILIEHFAGAFPTWLAPVQVEVIPISDKHLDYANKVLDTLKAAGIRADIDTRAEKMGYKIREAQLQKIPYMLVVGGKEEENEAVSVRSRFKGDEGQMKLDDFLAAIKEEIANRENRKVEKED